MKILIFIISIFYSNFVFAENVTLDFRRIPVSSFVSSTYRTILNRDYVLSPEVLADDLPISVRVKSIDSSKVGAMVDVVLRQHGITVSQNEGIYYLDYEKSNNNDSSRSFVDREASSKLKDKSSLLPSSFVDEEVSNKVDPAKEYLVIVPLNRKADFLAAAINSVFPAKQTVVVAGNSLVISGTSEMLLDVLSVVEQIDKPLKKIKINASFVEVSNSDSASRGISVMANFLGAKFGVKLGEISNSSLVFNARNFQLVLDALDGDARFKQVSSPSTTCDDQTKSSLAVGDSVPTIGSSSLDKNGNAVQQITYQQSGVTLDVSPSVIGSGLINLVVSGQVSSFSPTTSGVNGSPTLSKRAVNTTVTIRPGEVLVIGGLEFNKSNASSTGFAFLPRSLALNTGSNSTSDLVLLLSASVMP